MSSGRGASCSGLAFGDSSFGFSATAWGGAMPGIPAAPSAGAGATLLLFLFFFFLSAAAAAGGRGHGQNHQHEPGRHPAAGSEWSAGTTRPAASAGRVRVALAAGLITVVFSVDDSVHRTTS